MDYGILSILPVVTVFIVAISTKRTLVALFSGSVVGAIILGLSGTFGTWWNYFYSALGNGDAEWLMAVTCLFGILVVLFEESGAVTEFAVWSRRYVTSERKSLILTMILGIVVFLDDYLNNMVVSTAMKPMTDKYDVPRTKLAYIVNSTAAPVCLLIPISTWAVFFGTLFEGEGITFNGSGIGAYIHAIPMVFYPWLALIVVILVVLGILPNFGPMKKHEKSAKEDGKVFPDLPPYAELNESSRAAVAEEAKEEESGVKGNPVPFLLPIAVMIAVTLLTGIDVLSGTAAAIATSIIIILVTKKMNVGRLCDSIFNGVLSMTFVFVLVLFAYMVQGMNTDLGLAEYVISVVEPLMNGGFLPAVVFVFCAIYAYCTGCFWDLAAIIMPLVIPLAIAMDVDPILAGAAVFSGAGFGSNTCMYGDAMILVSKATDLRPTDAMLATLPYAMIAGVGTIILYLIFGFVMM